MTPAEEAAWKLLRDRRLAGVKFRRQHPVGPYVMDFCCATLRFGIEIDGGVHDSQTEDDHYRQRELEGWGYRILRFSNELVLQRPDDFLDTIVANVADIAAQKPLFRAPGGYPLGAVGVRVISSPKSLAARRRLDGAPGG